MAAEMEGEFVVFLIGMRVNKFWAALAGLVSGRFVRDPDGIRSDPIRRARDDHGRPDLRFLSADEDADHYVVRPSIPIL